ncbi:MAG: RNA-binding protein [Nannocystaceae bacterium]|nr:RNA-binding protein [Nannocystaceae bacterium]
MLPRPHTLYVGGLPPEMDSVGLASLFRDYGELAAARVIMRPSTNLCRGFGYVSFVTAAAAELARRALDGRELSGSRLRVAPAT